MLQGKIAPIHNFSIRFASFIEFCILGQLSRPRKVKWVDFLRIKDFKNRKMFLRTNFWKSHYLRLRHQKSMKTWEKLENFKNYLLLISYFPAIKSTAIITFRCFIANRFLVSNFWWGVPFCRKISLKSSMCSSKKVPVSY